MKRRLKTKNFYEKLFYSALRIRMVEEKIVEIYPTDKIQSPVHLSIGQEHHAAAICAALHQKDQLFATYRNHAFYLAKGGDINLMFAELYGKRTGVSKGKAGSMHLSFSDAGLMGSSAIVGSLFSHAIGAAYAMKLKKNGKIAVVMAGDGSTEEGAFHECMNFASLKSLPILFVIENNGLAIHSYITERQSYDLKILSNAYRINYILAEDSFAMVAIYEMAAKIRKEILKASRPALLEIKTYRYKSHVGIEDDYDKGYRDIEELKNWQRQDPLIINKGLIEEFRQEIQREIVKAVNFAEKSRFPKYKELLSDVF